MSSALLISLHPLNRVGGGEHYTMQAFRSVGRSKDSCIGYALSEFFPPSSSLDARLRRQFVPFNGAGILQERSVSFRQVLTEAAEFEFIWVHQYLSSIAIIDILTNCAGDQKLVLTGLGHEREIDRFRAFFQPCPAVFIVEISSYAAQRSSVFGPRVSTVSGGVWLDEIASSEVMQWKKRGQICCLGRVLPHKGIETAIQAAPQGTTLLITGANDLDRSYTYWLRSLTSRAEVQFLGHVSNEARTRILTESEILVACSTTTLFDGRVIPQAELLGLVILEALAACVLPIVSDVPPFVEVMTNLGLSEFVFRQRSHDDLNRVMGSALGLEPRERRKIILAAQKRLNDHYLWDDFWPRVKAAIGSPVESSPQRFIA